jgi:diguanylate cyclase (GGDEF)-like protein
VFAACAALTCYALVMVALLVVNTPTIGISAFFVIPIAVVAMNSGPLLGSAAAVCAGLLYGFNALIEPPPGLDAASLWLGVLVRTIAFLTTGLLLGWFAKGNRLLVLELRAQAECDHLTGVGNARAYESAVRRRTAHDGVFALLLCDMDGLKDINDRHGHEVGDAALRALSQTLGSLTRDGDDIVRVGGDEFCVLTTVSREEEAESLAARLEEHLDGAGTPATFGWAVHPFDSHEVDSLFAVADRRLYARKAERAVTGASRRSRAHLSAVRAAMP